MKKLFILMLAALLTVSISSTAMANGYGLGIVGSPHDFTDDMKWGEIDEETEGKVAFDESWNARNEICRVCHVPHDHNRDTQYYLNGLLWNHAVSDATYTMYNSSWSSTLDNFQESQPEGIAKLCLGCHDGTVGIDTFDKYAGDSVFMEDYDEHFQHPGPDMQEGAVLDLRGTHPLSIIYDEAVDTNLNPRTDDMGNSGTIQSVLDAQRVQCSSCHDVHDQEAVGGTHLLRVAQTEAQGGTASGLCLTCHAKDETYDATP